MISVVSFAFVSMVVGLALYCGVGSYYSIQTIKERYYGTQAAATISADATDCGKSIRAANSDVAAIGASSAHGVWVCDDRTLK